MNTTSHRGGRPLLANQAAVVDHVADHRVTVVSAGAGSGKTETMVATVVHLVDVGVARLHDFALITFTRKAAAELRERLVTAVRARAETDERWAAEEEHIGAVFVGTIHAFCLHVLRAFGAGVVVARQSEPALADYRRSRALLDALEALIEDDPVSSSPLQQLVDPDYRLVELAKDVLDYCGTIGLSPEELLESTTRQADDAGKAARVAFMRMVARGAAAYRADKADAGILDADDLLHTLADAVRGAGTGMAATVADRFPCVFVDEFQDTDITQLAVVEGLLPRLRRLLVVGDRKQAIYGWRAADASLLDRLATQHMGGSPLRLRVSMRPTPQLLRVQNALFAVMADRYPDLGDSLESTDAPPPTDPLCPLEYYQVSRDGSPSVIAEHLRGLFNRRLPGTGRVVEPGDVAVLVRSNGLAEHYAEQLATALLSERVGVVVDRGASLYRMPAVVATYRMLRLIHEPRRDVALQLATATPYLAGADLSEAARKRLEGNDEMQLVDWFEAEYPELATPLAELRRAAPVDTVPQLLGRLYRVFDVRSLYAGDIASLDHLELLRERARVLSASEQALTLGVFVDWLAAAIRTGRSDGELDALDATGRPPHVRVMTIHRAKGLQFPVVVVPHLMSPVVKGDGMPEFFADDDGLDLRIASSDVQGDIRSPRFDSKVGAERQARIEEEFRLFYVAVTRAQHQVVLVGGHRGTPNRVDSDRYSWRDEVARARDALQRAGAAVR